jgi:hypothetical protein
MRTITTHPADTPGKWFYRMHDDDPAGPYESPAIYHSAGAARRAGLRDVELSDMLDAEEPT